MHDDTTIAFVALVSHGNQDATCPCRGIDRHSSARLQFGVFVSGNTDEECSWLGQSQRVRLKSFQRPSHRLQMHRVDTSPWARVRPTYCSTRSQNAISPDAALARFHGVHLLFNNAGVGAGGLIWENSVADWEWVLGVNQIGRAHV